MKTACFILFTLGPVLMPGFRASAQEGVGVNTENPQGAFHVKAGNRDVVVSHSTGHVGIHTATPQAKLEIASPAPGVPALQIIDGRQGSGRILTSDSDGNARWSIPIGSAGKLETVLELGPQDIAVTDSVDVPSSHFTVREDGYHVYEIRWYATYASEAPRHISTATHLQLIRRPAGTGTDEVADEFEMYHDITRADDNGDGVYNDDAVTFWLSLSTQAKAGDELSLTVRPGIAHGALLLRKAGTLTTSKVIVKRLNVR
jgi:hypothetical protein